MRYSNGGYIGYAPTPSISGELDGIWRYTDVTKNIRNNNWYSSTTPTNARISPSSVTETTGTSITLTCLFDNDLSGFVETFQWQTSLNNSIWTNISGQNNNTLLFTMASGDNNTYRRCKIDRGFKSVFATSAEIYVALDTITISIQPDNLTRYAGETANFTVVAGVESEATINYQWQVSTNGGSSWSNAPGSSTSASYSFVPPYSYNGYLYRCYLTATGAAPITSNSATLTVDNVTIFIGDPPDNNSCGYDSGGYPTFSVSAYIYPTGILSYAWYKSTSSDGPWSLITSSDTGFSGYTTSTLTIDCSTQSSNWYLKCRLYWSIIEIYTNPPVIYDDTEYNPFP